jgi:hypothetical protein
MLQIQLYKIDLFSEDYVDTDKQKKSIFPTIKEFTRGILKGNCHVGCIL